MTLHLEGLSFFSFGFKIAFLDALTAFRYDETMLLVYALSHFVMDFACAAFLFGGKLLADQGLYGVLIYNFCAFALQMPLGLLTDSLDRNASMAAFGCALTAAAGLLGNSGWMTCALLGIGNALFHLGGGVDVLNESETDCGRLGVFVAPGALGLFWGKLFGKGPLFSREVVAFVLLLATCVILISAMRYGKLAASGNGAVSLSPRGKTPRSCLWGAAGLFFVVVLRSFLGQQWNRLEPRSLMMGFLGVLAAVFGKAFGGFAFRRFGIGFFRFSQGIAALCFALSGWIPLFGIPALFFINTTMPVTLWGLARIFQGAEGFAFGLLTLALFLGALPFLTDASGGFPVSFPAWPGALVLAGLTLLGNGIMEKCLDV